MYLLIIVGLALALRKRFTNESTKRYFMPALMLKLFGAAMVGLIYDFNYDGGDSFGYYTLSSYLNNAFYDSPWVFMKVLFSNGEYDPETFFVTSRIWWYESPSEFLIIKVCAVLGLFCFHTYTVIAFCFAVFAFSGLWATFITFQHFYPKLHKEFAISLFFLPSLVFWGSGLLKDSVCLGALGWMFYAFHQMFIRRRSIISSILIIIMMAYIIKVIKVYILICFLPAVMLWLFMEYNRKLRSMVAKLLVRPLLLVLGLAAAFFAMNAISQGDERYEIDKIAETNKTTADYIHRMSVAQGGAAYSIGELDGTFAGMIKLAPQAIFVTLYRPFLWEVRNPVMLLGALESFGFLAFTLYIFYKAGFLRTISVIRKEPLVLICLVFAIIFSFAVGVSTFNFGTLARYKIPMMPFYIAAMFIVRDKTRKDVPLRTQAGQGARRAIPA